MHPDRRTVGSAARDRARPGIRERTPDEWIAAHVECLEHLRTLVRFKTVNPPGDEVPAAQYIGAVLGADGIAAKVLEPFPGRGSVVARVRGDGSGGGPLLMLSHLDVVPAAPDRWTHDPFAADLADGKLWGRGALDMKSAAAFELQVMLLLARHAKRLGRDPASDPIPGLGRDVIFACTADEEAGGARGLGWIVDHHPELVQADGAINEACGFGIARGDRRVYPVQVAEKGLAWYRVVVSGSWGHGAVPHQDNAIETAAAVVQALARSVKPTIVPTVNLLLDAIADRVGRSDAARVRAAILGEDDDPSCAEPLAGVLRAIGRTTITVNVMTAGLKVNVIPGEAELEIDCRPLPGTDPTDVEGLFRSRVGEDLWSRTAWSAIATAPALVQPPEHPLLAAFEVTLADHDPGGVMVPTLVPFITDAKHTARLGIPTYGMTPLRIEPGDPFLELLHGDDERVSLSALEFGLEFMHDLVWRYAGRPDGGSKQVRS